MYLYHRVPPNMVGTTLYPLNQLKGVAPDAYEVHSKKYDDRRQLMRYKVPILNCLWNDALFLMAVPPKIFLDAYYGMGFPRRRPMRFYRVEISKLEWSRLCVLVRMSLNQPMAFERLDVQNFYFYQKVPAETFAYWRREKALGNDRPFLFMHIPHFLYDGVIDISDAPIIE